MIDKLFSIERTRQRNGTAGEKGTGLGLMLSYEFVKPNGGHIEVESVLGKGTTFKTSLQLVS
jgi:signal transduction histidine kinase